MLQKTNVIKNNMFGDTLYALALFLKGKNEKIYYLPGSILEQISIHFNLQKNCIKITNITPLEKAFLFFSKKIHISIYNIIHNKILSKNKYFDVCYPKISDNKVRRFLCQIKSCSPEIRNHVAERLKTDRRYFRVCEKTVFNFSSCYLAYKIKQKIKLNKSFYNSKRFVCINIKPKTLSEKIGIKNTFRSVTKWEHLENSVKILQQRGYDIFCVNESKIISKNNHTKHIKSKFITNFIAVYHCKFVISSQNGFLLLPALFGKDKIELNTTDFSGNLQPNSFNIFPKVYKNNLICEKQDFFFTKLFYFHDFSKIKDDYTIKSQSNKEIANLLKKYLDWKESKRINFLNSKPFLTKQHLHAYYYPYFVLNLK